MGHYLSEMPEQAHVSAYDMRSLEWLRRDLAAWSETHRILKGLQTHYNDRFKSKVEDLLDFAKARIWEIEARCVQ